MTDQLQLYICEHFKADTLAVLSSGNFSDVTASFFPSRCSRPMKASMQLSSLKLFNKGKDEDQMFCGCSCMTNTDKDFLDKKNILQINLSNCFQMFAPQTQIDQLLIDGVYIITPDWLSKWKVWVKNWGDKEQVIQMFSESVTKLVLLDTGVNPKSNDNLKEFSTYINCPSETIHIGLDYYSYYLENKILKWRLEQKTNKPDAKVQDSESDYAMALDLMTNLHRAEKEDVVANRIMENLNMLFAARKISYLSIEDSKPVNLWSLPSDTGNNETKERLSKCFQSVRLTESGKGFCFNIIIDDEVLAVIEIEDLVFPENLMKYQNLALAMAGVLAFSIQNSRYFQNVLDINDSLKESEEKFRLLIENSADMVTLHDSDGRYLFYSGPQKYLINSSDVVGKTPYDFFEKDIAGKIIKQIKETAKTGEHKKIEIYVNWQGKMTWFEESIYPIIKEENIISVVKISSEINVRKNQEIELIKAKEKAEENQKLYEDLVQSSYNLIWRCDLEGKYTFLNLAWESSHGYKVEEMLGRPFSDFQRPEVFERDVIEFTKHLEGGFVKDYETTHTRIDGTEIPLIFNALPLYNSKGEIIGTQGTAFDISKLKQTESDLIKAKEKAEENDRLKTSFLANMSHEIRTPMNGILGFTDLLKEPKLSGEEQGKYISVIESSGNRLLNTVNDLIDISKIEAGQMQVSISEVDINKLNEDLFTFFKGEAKKKQLQLFLSASSLSNVIVLNDKEKIYAILTNLIKNSIKYTQRGSVEYGYQKKGDELEFFVKDTGNGISKERLEVIFDRFIRGGVHDEAVEGSGLGLSITKAYVEMVGGKIWVESEAGVGSQFYFTIPYKSIETEFPSTKEVDSKTKAKLQLNPEFSGLKILIAEDDVAADKLLSILIKDISEEVIHTKSGASAVELCRNNPDLDLILMDINMLEMDGYEAAKQIREFNKEVIIIAQTAYALAGDRKKSMGAGCNGYITKPINKSELLEEIKNSLSRK